jgi:hypothetical protein
VLHHRGDDVVALFLVELGDALEGEVVRLGGAGREDDFFFALRADELGDALAGVVDSFFCGPNFSVKYGNISSRTRRSMGVVEW